MRESKTTVMKYAWGRVPVLPVNKWMDWVNGLNDMERTAYLTNFVMAAQYVAGLTVYLIARHQRGRSHNRSMREAMYFRKRMGMIFNGQGGSL